MPKVTEQQSLTPRQVDHTPKTSKERLILPDPHSMQLHSKQWLQRIENDRKKAAADRRAGREKGKLTRVLHESLRACNPLQLNTVRTLVAKYEKDHRTPPSLIYCRQKQTVDILAHTDVLNRRCTLELQRSSRSRGKVYVNGPYAVVHYRDGAIIKHDYIGNKKLSTRLPRSVWLVFRPAIASAETLA
jgi:hypothetical protein